MNNFFNEVLDHFKTSLLDDSEEEYCPYFQDGVAIQQLSRAMLGLRFQPSGNDGVSEHMAIAADQSINATNSAREGDLIAASFTIGGQISSLTVSLDSADQYNNLLISPNSEFRLRKERTRYDRHFYSETTSKSDSLTPDSLKNLKYGFTVYRQWFEYIGMALGTCLIKFGSEALRNDIDSYTPTLQASWDWLAKNLIQSDSAWE